MLLIPYNGLREVQPRRLENRRIVGTIGVAAPNVEGPTRQQHTREIAKPRLQQTHEFRVADEIIGQGSIAGTQLAVGGTCFLRMAGQIQELMVLGTFKRAQTGG